MTRPWHRRAAWKRGPLGALHAQWLDEEIPGAACCSEEAALAGPSLPYDGKACRACVRLVLSLASQSASTTSANPRPLEVA